MLQWPYLLICYFSNRQSIWDGKCHRHELIHCGPVLIHIEWKKKHSLLLSPCLQGLLHLFALLLYHCFIKQLDLVITNSMAGVLGKRIFYLEIYPDFLFPVVDSLVGNCYLFNLQVSLRIIIRFYYLFDSCSLKFVLLNFFQFV